MPADLQAEVAKLTPPTTAEYIAFAKEAYAAFHGRSGRIRFMLAPSAPQRCTPELMQAANELAREWQVPFHTHIVETKVQGVTGPALYGKSLMRYMADLGLMHPGVTIAHSIWVTRGRHRADGRGRRLHRPQHHLQPEARAPASPRCASCWTPASMSRSARTASAPTTRRACST